MSESTVEQRVATNRDLRQKVLQWMYAHANGCMYPSNLVSPEYIANEMDEDLSQVASVLLRLEDDGILKTSRVLGHQESMGIHAVGITAYGLEAAEEMITPSTQPTDVPPLANLIVIGNMTGSSIVQASQDVVMRDNDISDTINLISALREISNTVELSPQDKIDFDANLSTAEAQSKTSRPSPNLIAGALNLAKDILVAAGGSAVLVTLKSQFPSVFGTN